MKKLILTFALMLCITSFSQSKRDILQLIDIEQRTIIANKPFDVSKSKLMEAMMYVGGVEYQQSTRESESRGFCEWYYEDDVMKQWLTMEIRNESQPYVIGFSIKSETRSKDYIKQIYSPWVTSYGINQPYVYKLQKMIFYYLFGPPELSAELQEKIEAYNSTQKKEKNKILKNREY